MAAATKNRNTAQRAGRRRGYPLAATVHALAGTIAVMNATGFAEPGTTATGLVALGAFSAEHDNRNGAAGALIAEVERGIFHFDNSEGADEITASDIGKVCYLVDDQTVALTDGTATRSPVGFIDEVDDAGVWVSIDPLQLAALTA